MVPSNEHRLVLLYNCCMSATEGVCHLASTQEETLTMTVKSGRGSNHIRS